MARSGKPALPAARERNAPKGGPQHLDDDRADGRHGEAGLDEDDPNVGPQNVSAPDPQTAPELEERDLPIAARGQRLPCPSMGEHALAAQAFGRLGQVGQKIVRHLEARLATGEPGNKASMDLPFEALPRRRRQKPVNRTERFVELLRPDESSIRWRRVRGSSGCFASQPRAARSDVGTDVPVVPLKRSHSQRPIQSNAS
jgi:hypothetical protein